LVLVEELGVARDRLDRATELMEWSMDLREHLTWSVFDIDDARDEVFKFKRAVEAYRRNG
jgi:hypothetical protein